MCDICNDKSEAEYWQRVLDLVLTYGWTVQYVLGENDRNPPFAYTIGLSLSAHPEFIVFACEPERAHRSLEPLARAVVEGRRFDEGDDLSSLYPFLEKPELLRFPDSSTHLLVANRMFRAEHQPPVPALQLYWPPLEPLLAGDR